MAVQNSYSAYENHGHPALCGSCCGKNISSLCGCERGTAEQIADSAYRQEDQPSGRLKPLQPLSEYRQQNIHLHQHKNHPEHTVHAACCIVLQTGRRIGDPKHLRGCPFQHTPIEQTGGCDQQHSQIDQAAQP